MRLFAQPRDLRDRRGDIIGVGRLEPRPAVAEYWIGRQDPKQPENGREKAVVGGEHHRRADDDHARECGLDGRLAFAATANIGRRRGRVGADPRQVNQSFGPDPPRYARDPGGRLDMHRVERIAAVLDVQADGIDPAIGAGEGALHGTPGPPNAVTQLVRGSIRGSWAALSIEPSSAARTASAACAGDLPLLT